MRMSSTLIHNNIVNSLNKTSELVNMYNSQLLSGKKVQKISDDPISLTSIMNNRNQLYNMEQYDKNISTAKSHLQSAEGALNGISDIILRTQELLLKGNNDTNTEESRESIALELEELKQQVGVLANTKFGDYFVFGGMDTKTKPYDTEKGVWNANPNANKSIEVEISKEVFVPLNVDSDGLFNGVATEKNIFDFFTEAITNIRNGNGDKLTERLSELNNIQNRVLKTISGIGATINRIDIVKSKNEDFKLSINEDLSNKQDVDIQELYINLTSAKMSYQAGASVAAKIMQQSLLDFIK